LIALTSEAKIIGSAWKKNEIALPDIGSVAVDKIVKLSYQDDNQYNCT
jgi:hypothetical protein